jgi:hypothetical protein
MRRVDFQIDGTAIDPFVTTGNPCGLGLDLPADLREVIEAAIWLMQELSEFRRICWRLAAFFVSCGDIDQLENKRTTGDNPCSAGQKIASYDILQYRRLSATLRADDDLDGAKQLIVEASNGAVCGSSTI